MPSDARQPHYTSYEIEWSPNDSNVLKELPRLFNTADEMWETARKLYDMYPDSTVFTLKMKVLRHD